jgi:hypothetical protein
MEWIALSRFHIYNSSHAFERTEEVIRNYKVHKENLIAKNIKMSDYILSQITTPRRIVFLKNSFPYHLDSRIHHIVAWTHNDVSFDELRWHLINIHNLVEIQDFIAFENSIELRTIPDMKHYHTFVKKDSHLDLLINDYQ